MIDKNVPLPTNRADSGKWSSIAESMEVGDSYLDANGVSSSASGSKSLSAFIQYGKKHGMTFTARKVDGGVRIWRAS